MSNPKIIFPKLNKTFLQLLGPSIVFVALALSGGEILLWPDLVGRFGLSILWPIPLILLLQFAVNIEIERYTITTGENVMQGLFKFFPFLRFIFVIAILVTLVWPAWVSTSGNILSYTLGFGQYGSWVSIGLMLLLILIWFNIKSYYLIENIARYGLLLILAIGFTTLYFQFNWEVLLTSFGNFTLLPTQANDKFTFLSALAYGGVTGVLNLVQSAWVINKKYGLKSASSDSNLQLQDIDWENKESIQNWRRWWNAVTKEHFVIFYLGNLLGVILVSTVAFFTLNNQNLSGFAILEHQVDFMNQQLWFLGSAWGIGIFLLFLMAQMTILEACGKLLSQCFQNSRLQNISSNTISQLVGIIGVGILLLISIIPGFNQPAILLQISASLSAVVIVIHPIFIIWINQNKLPIATRPKIWNWILILSCVFFYLGMCIWSII